MSGALWVPDTKIRQNNYWPSCVTSDQGPYDDDALGT
jgi:hypothetical protein